MGAALVVALAAALAVASLLVAWPVPDAEGQETPRLAGPVTDLADAVGSTQEIERAVDELQRERGIQLFVLYVETTGDDPLESYVDEVARLNNLGASDALLAVAIDDRTYQLWLGDLAIEEVSQDEQDRLLATKVEPELRNGDYGGAAIGAVSGIEEAIGGQAGSDGGGGNAGRIVLVVLTIVGVIAAAAIAYLFVAARRRRGQAEEQERRRAGELARRANGLLLQADDALRDGEQELAFAVAEFSEQEVAPLRESLGRAKQQLKDAFAVRQALDDAEPESAREKEQLLQRIIQHCEAALAQVADQRRVLEEARDLERRAPELLAALPQRLDAMDEKVQAAAANLERLREYAPSSWRTVQGNLEEAQKRIAYVRDGLDDARRAHERGEARPVAAYVRDAQSTLGDATALLDAVDGLARSMQDAQAKLATQLPAAETDIRAARGALSAGAAPELHARIEQAEAALARARSLTADARPDVIEAHRLAVEAESLADDVLRTTQEAAAAARRERQIAEQAIASATSSVRRAADYVLTRRDGGIGRRARTRLSEAERELDHARELVDSDPREATKHAQSAHRLADDAVQLAQEDFGTFGRRRRRRGWSGGDLGLGIALGGILLGRGGGFGGTRWGSPRGGGGFRLPGGFGGGGRSRGGRW